jgi:hypothetical protein
MMIFSFKMSVTQCNGRRFFFSCIIKAITPSRVDIYLQGVDGASSVRPDVKGPRCVDYIPIAMKYLL